MQSYAVSILPHITAAVLAAVIDAIPGIDNDRTATALAHVLVRFSSYGNITVTASDGTMCLEETIALAGRPGVTEDVMRAYADVPDLLMPPHEPLFRRLLRMTLATRAHKAANLRLCLHIGPAEGDWSRPQRDRRITKATIVGDLSNMQLFSYATPDCLFPSHAEAFTPGRAPNQATTVPFTIDLRVLRRLSKAWKDMLPTQAVTFNRGKGFIVTPATAWNDKGRTRRALIMPCAV